MTISGPDTAPAGSDVTLTCHYDHVHNTDALEVRWMTFWYDPLWTTSVGSEDKNHGYHDWEVSRRETDISVAHSIVLHDVTGWHDGWYVCDVRYQDESVYYYGWELHELDVTGNVQLSKSVCIFNILCIFPIHFFYIFNIKKIVKRSEMK